MLGVKSDLTLCDLSKRELLLGYFNLQANLRAMREKVDGSHSKGAGGSSHST